jgi:uncharacterized OB-fold protein
MMEYTAKAYFDFIGERRIMGSRCGACGDVSLPPRPVCMECGSVELDWEEFEGRGEVRAFSVINIPLSRMEGRCPYAVGVVKLDDGPSVSGLILGVTSGDELSVGSRVEAEYVKEGEKTALCFRLVR